MSARAGFLLDASSTSVVVVCIACGWRTLTTDRDEGRTHAASHERRAHPGQTLAANALSTAKKRARKVP